MTAPPAELLSIGRAAQQLGVSPRALRYYEQVGLVTPTGRTDGGHRLYSPEDLLRVSRIRELQELMGFNLDEIRAVLTAEDRLAELRLAYRAATESATRTSVVDEIATLYDALRAQVTDKLTRLETFRDELDQRARRARSARDR